MRAIQFFLITLAVVIMFTTLHRRRSPRSQALKKVGLLATVLVAICAIAAPGWVQAVAEALGIGRGADLVLYVTTLALIYVATDVYLRFQETDRRIAELARSLAIERAEREQEVAEARTLKDRTSSEVGASPDLPS